MSQQLVQEKFNLLKDRRENRAYRIGFNLSRAGLILGIVTTIVDILYNMPLIVLIGDVALLSGCGLSYYFSRNKERAVGRVWAPLYFGIWAGTFTSLFVTGGVHSPFLGDYLILLFVGGIVMQPLIKPLTTILFTLLNFGFWLMMEIILPGAFGDAPPVAFVFIVNGIVIGALMVYVHEFIVMERSLADEIVQRYHDVEKARQAALKEETANTAKTNFLANISHELRTPLGAILGYAELIQEPNLDTKRRLDYSETILRNGYQLARLVDDLLDMSKVEAGKLEIEKLPFCTNKLFNDVIELLQIQAQKKNLNLRLIFKDKIPDGLISDPNRIKQILTNIIGNAIKFTQQGEITVRVAYILENSRLHIEVQDTGVGMSYEELSRLFKPYTQGDVSVARKYGGTGLGLSLSKSLAILLGGDLYLGWSQPGLGSQFVLEVPVLRNQGSQMTERKISIG